MLGEGAVRGLFAERDASGLLQACRCEGFGTEAYAQEPIAALLRLADPAPLDGTYAVGADGHLAVFDVRRAVVADVHGDRIGRLWVLGQIRVPDERPASVAVPHDADLQQSRASRFFEAADHPMFDPGHAGALPELCAAAQAALVEEIAHAHGAPLFRLRTFVVRAFSNAGTGALLLASEGLVGAGARRPFACYAAAHFRVDGGRLANHSVVVDGAGLAASLDARWRTIV